ncbi:MAG: L17 family ribosomal protein, partial [Candidatus Omnitrophota bacterium]|nr:L17 family ribosomal protein [Candidatus Omnitrophota bacterium]
LGDHALVSRLFNEIAPRFSGISGGYTRIINLGRRRGDDASVVIFELTKIKAKKSTAEKKHKKEEKVKPVEEQPAATGGESLPPEEKKREIEVAVKEKPPVIKKPSKKFLGGIRNIFKKERDSL